MSHRQQTHGKVSMPEEHDEWPASTRASEWDADTDVMPPEYCRQLLEISRQLQRAK